MKSILDVKRTELQNAVTAALNTSVTDTLNNSLTDLNEDVANALITFRNDVTNTFEMYEKNQRIYERNKISFLKLQNSTLYAPLKTKAGAGIGFPWVLRRGSSRIAVIPPINVGATPPGFPIDVFAFDELTKKHIHEFSVQYNADFEIKVGDAENVMVNKFREWIQGR